MQRPKSQPSISHTIYNYDKTNRTPSGEGGSRPPANGGYNRPTSLPATRPPPGGYNKPTTLPATRPPNGNYNGATRPSNGYTRPAVTPDRGYTKPATTRPAPQSRPAPASRPAPSTTRQAPAFQAGNSGRTERAASQRGAASAAGRKPQ